MPYILSSKPSFSLKILSTDSFTLLLPNFLVHFFLLFIGPGVNQKCIVLKDHRTVSLYIHCVAKVYAVLPFYDVTCLCSGRRE